MARERIRWPAVADRAREIVEGYEGGVTLCQVMYRPVYEGALPHTAPMYRRLSGQLAKARREHGLPELLANLRANDAAVVDTLRPALTGALQSAGWLNDEHGSGPLATGE